MLEIRNLAADYGSTRILSDITETLQRADSLAIVGETGAGKTTLAMGIMGLGDVRCQGEILLDGTDLLQLSSKQMEDIRWNEIAMVFQDVDGALNPLYPTIDQVAEPIIAHGLATKEDATRRAAELLSAVGLPEGAHRSFPHELSSGQKQRALIAMALSNDPSVLILDEPTASLDSVAKAHVVRLLREIGRSCSLVLITHDLSTVDELCDRTAVMYGGRIVEEGPTDAVLDRPLHPYTRGLIRSFPNMTTTKDLQSIHGRSSREDVGCPFAPRCTQAIERCHEVVPDLVGDDDHRVACHRGGIVPLLELRNLSKHFDSGFSVEGVDLTLYEGETVAIVGESGSGKTTIARTTMGLLERSGGEIRLEQHVIERQDKAFYRTVQMVFQNPRESINPRFTIREAVSEPLRVQRIGDRNEDDGRARAVLDEVGLPFSDDFLASHCYRLSSGEAQRVAIARALVLEPRLLIADEPTSALDPSVQAKIARLLLDLQQNRGLAMLFITHDIALARKIADRIIVVENGRVVEEGASSVVITAAAHAYTRSLVEAAATLTSRHARTSKERPVERA